MTKNVRSALIRVGVVFAACMLLFVLPSGCTSGTKDIARAAGNTQTLAAGIVAHSEALAPLVAENAEATAHVKAIDQNARDIHIEGAMDTTCL
jgi:hypothetical protein